MYILDATGEVLERNLSIIKIDVVLGDDFIFKVAESDDLDTIVKNYKKRLCVEIRSHDICRARLLKPVLDYYYNGGVHGLPIDYFMDTLSVIYSWCAKYRRVYMGRYYHEAFRDFYTFCRHTDAWSVKAIEFKVLEPMFTYIFCREHLSRHPHIVDKNIPGH